jgi:NTP pyrophosphatase (non-canonical NTP hydrolase)
MKAEHIKGRLHDAMHRGSHKATEEELAEVTAVVLAIVGELGAEMALLIAELEERWRRSKEPLESPVGAAPGRCAGRHDWARE